MSNEDCPKTPELSQFGQQLAQGSGIEELMEDLGRALADGDPETRMLGGGQPAHIPEVNALWRQRMTDIMDEPGRFERMLSNYDPPQGNLQFLRDLAQLLRDRFGWAITEKNIAVTAGGQTAFFLLFNALAGSFQNGQQKKILLPLVPEYIGYANQGSSHPLFKAQKPRLEITDEHEFKYRVDFDNLEITDDIAAICVSRPTNPSGNVLTDDEITRLRKLANQAGIPLIIDNAYGAPFPNIIFTEATPVWDENIILTLSLSKIGLPGTRTGIVIAREEIIKNVTSMTAISGLANNNIGQNIIQPLIANGDILTLSKDTVQPYYLKKSHQALHWAAELFDDSLPYYIHSSEGALFLWFWFKDLPISAAELYQRLKARKTLIVPGHYFFFGLSDEHQDWPHPHECIRVTYTMDDQTVYEGLRIIAEEVKKAYQGP